MGKVNIRKYKSLLVLLSMITDSTWEKTKTIVSKEKKIRSPIKYYLEIHFSSVMSATWTQLVKIGNIILHYETQLL